MCQKTMSFFKNLGSFISEYRIGDWFLAIILLVAGLGLNLAPLSSDFVEHINTDIGQSRHTDTISYWLVFIGELAIIPLLIFLICAFMVPHVSKNKLLAAYYFAIGANLVLSGGMKRFVGRPRPDTIAVCGGDGSYQKCKESLSKYQLADQFFSFPSGHSSEAMTALFFLSMFLSDVWPENSKFILVLRLFPMALAVFIGASRIWDRKHHVDDVVAGLFIGAVISGFVYSVYKQKPKNAPRSNLPI